MLQQSTDESLAYLQRPEDNTGERSRKLLFMLLLPLDIFNNTFLICYVQNAFDLHRAWPEACLRIGNFLV